MASRLEKEKNLNLAIRAFQNVIKKVPKTGLIIVGEGSLRCKIINQINNLHLSESVIVEPWVDKNTLYSYYKTADLFLNTSFFEGYGMTLVEAKAAGLKIISTDVGVAQKLDVCIIDYSESKLADAIVAELD